MRDIVFNYFRSIQDISMAHRDYYPCNKYNGPTTTQQGVSSQGMVLRQGGPSGFVEAPRSRTDPPLPRTHDSSCSYKNCFGDFGIQSDIKAILKCYAHPKVWAQMDAVSLSRLDNCYNANKVKYHNSL